MLTAQLIRNRQRKRLQIVALAIVFIFVLLALVVLRIEQIRLELLNIKQIPHGLAGPLCVALLGIPILTSVHLATSVAEHFFGTQCPHCDKKIINTRMLLVTKCCPSCQAQIVEGPKTRTKAVWKRYSKIKKRAFLKYWFWFWPIGGAALIALQLLFEETDIKILQWLIIYPIIGAGAAGWAFVRTWNTRYFPQFVTSLGVLISGSVLFWYSI